MTLTMTAAVNCQSYQSLPKAKTRNKQKPYGLQQQKQEQRFLKSNFKNKQNVTAKYLFTITLIIVFIYLFVY